MRSPLISVILGFFSVSGGCSMLAEFPSCADTEMKLNRQIDRSKNRTIIRDFIDVSKELPSWKCESARPVRYREEADFCDERPLVNRGLFNPAADRPTLIERIFRPLRCTEPWDRRSSI